MARRVLPGLVSGLGAQVFLDAPCGDGAWVPPLTARYIGVDIVPEAVARARAARGNRGRQYHVMDLCTDTLPEADVVLTRDAIQHLSFADGLAVIANIRKTGATWLIASTYEGGDNVDILTGGYYQPDLEREPFSLGKPWCVIEDGYWDSGVVFPNKFLGVWAL